MRILGAMDGVRRSAPGGTLGEEGLVREGGGAEGIRGRRVVGRIPGDEGICDLSRIPCSRDGSHGKGLRSKVGEGDSRRKTKYLQTFQSKKKIAE